MKQKVTHHHGDLRNAVISYLVEQTRSGEIQDVSMRIVAKELGVTGAAFYKHFSSKDDVMEEMAGVGFDVLSQGFDDALKSTDLSNGPAEARIRFKALCSAYVSFARSYPGLWKLMFGRASAPTGPSNAGSRSFEYLAMVFDELASEGVINACSVEQRRTLAWCAMHGLSDLSGSSTIASFGTLEDVIDEFVSLLLS